MSADTDNVVTWTTEQNQHRLILRRSGAWSAATGKEEEPQELVFSFDEHGGNYIHVNGMRYYVNGGMPDMDSIQRIIERDRQLTQAKRNSLLEF